MLVMKKSAGGGQTLIQQVGPDFSRLSRDLNRVVLKIQHQEDTGDCPMHSAEGYESRRGSRAHENVSDSRRGSRAYDHRSSSAEINSSSGHRLLSARNSNPETQYMSLPRRLSSAHAQSKSSSSSVSNKVDRRQSFQDFKTFRDKFTGPLDFKSTLRSSSSSGNVATPSSRQHRDYDRTRAGERKSRNFR